MPEVALEHGAI